MEGRIASWAWPIPERAIPLAFLSMQDGDEAGVLLSGTT